MTYLRNNIGFEGDKGFIPKGLPGHPENRLLEYQPEKAAALVKNFEKQTAKKLGSHWPQIQTTSTSANTYKGNYKK